MRGLAEEIWANWRASWKEICEEIAGATGKPVPENATDALAHRNETELAELIGKMARRELAVCVAVMQSAMLSDSGFEPPTKELMEALESDFKRNGQIPNKKECEELVMGDDLGEISQELQRKFPVTNKYLGELF